MADLRDEQGNPIQLTDERGNPVQLTDELGNPVHITGIATSQPLPLGTTVVQSDVPDTGLLASSAMEEPPKTVGECIKQEEEEQRPQQQQLKDEGLPLKDEGPRDIERSTSSSTSSSEDDGQGGRRKKKGLKQKIKEKLAGHGKHKEENGQTVGVSSTPTTTTNLGGGGGEPHEHEKKSVMEKIKEKLPGHGHHPHTH